MERDLKDPNNFYNLLLSQKRGSNYQSNNSKQQNDDNPENTYHGGLFEQSHIMRDLQEREYNLQANNAKPQKDDNPKNTYHGGLYEQSHIIRDLEEREYNRQSNNAKPRKNDNYSPDYNEGLVDQMDIIRNDPNFVYKAHPENTKFSIKKPNYILYDLSNKDKINESDKIVSLEFDKLQKELIARKENYDYSSRLYMRADDIIVKFYRNGVRDDLISLISKLNTNDINSLSNSIDSTQGKKVLIPLLYIRGKDDLLKELKDNKTNEYIYDIFNNINYDY